MKKQEIDHILVKMLDYHREVSDLNFTVGKPMQVESAGELIPVDFKPNFKALTPFQTEVIAMNLINQDRRLTHSLLSAGSCDMSYSLPGKARFRVNIFSQGANMSIVCRKLESKIPTIEEQRIGGETKGASWPTGVAFLRFFLAEIRYDLQQRHYFWPYWLVIAALLVAWILLRPARRDW